MCQFSAKMGSFDFSTQIFPKLDLGFEIQKSNVGIRISILKIPCVPNSGKNFNFFGPTLSKYGFRVRNSENKCSNKN